MREKFLIGFSRELRIYFNTVDLNSFICSLLVITFDSISEVVLALGLVGESGADLMHPIFLL